jgi:hypothetical protein
MANDWVMANDLGDLDGAKGGPQPAEDREPDDEHESYRPVIDQRQNRVEGQRVIEGRTEFVGPPGSSYEPRTMQNREGGRSRSRTRPQL